MCATCTFELKKHLCEKRRLLLKKCENIKISKYPITVTLNGEVQLTLLLTSSKKSWMYQLLLFIFSLRYFVGHNLFSSSEILL